MRKLTDNILIDRTYSTVVMLMTITDTVCPDFLNKDMQLLIGKCFDKLPEQIKIDLRVEK